MFCFLGACYCILKLIKILIQKFFWCLDFKPSSYFRPTSGNTTKQICPYAIHVFDLKTDTRIRKYQFRPQDILPGTFIANIAIDVGKTCEDTFLYASDELAYGLLSYSWEQNTSWRASHGFFFPDPLLGKCHLKKSHRPL